MSEIGASRQFISQSGTRTGDFAVTPQQADRVRPVGVLTEIARARPVLESTRMTQRRHGNRNIARANAFACPEYVGTSSDDRRKLLPQSRKCRLDPRKERIFSELRKYTLCFGKMLKRGLPPALGLIQ